MRQDALQLLLAGYEGDLPGRALHGGHQVAGVDLTGWGVSGQQLGHLSPGFFRGQPQGQGQQRGVLRLGQHWLQCVQVGVAGQQPDQRQELGVHAEPGQVGVADAGEQPLVVPAGDRLQ